MLLTGLVTLCAGTIQAQTRIEPGDTVEVAGWVLTDQQMIELTARLENLIQDSTFYSQRSIWADSLNFLTQSRLGSCRVMLSATDSLLTQAIEVADRRTFFEKIPPIVWLSVGLFIGSR